MLNLRLKGCGGGQLAGGVNRRARRAAGVSPARRVPVSAAGPSRGFTLVELLVVIAVVTALAGLLLPAVSRAKAKGAALLCLNNARQLTLGWMLYADDAGGRLPYNLWLDYRRHGRTVDRRLNWVDNIMTWELDPGNTNLAFVRESPLGSYLGYAAGVFRCPADQALSWTQKRAGWTARVRSVAMNAMVGDAGPNVQGGGNILNPGYRQFLRLTDITEPDHIFVIVDEHPDSIGDGYFYNNADDPEWVHLPASWHSGGANFSFADGHAEGHRWVLSQTKPPSRPEGASLPMTLPPDGTADYRWMADRTSVELGP